MVTLEVKQDGSVYIQPDKIMVDNQMYAHDLIARHHPETAVNDTILCNPGIYQVDCEWTTVDAKVARILSTGDKHKQMPLTGEVAILKESPAHDVKLTDKDFKEWIGESPKEGESQEEQRFTIEDMRDAFFAGMDHEWTKHFGNIAQYKRTMFDEWIKTRKK